MDDRSHDIIETINDLRARVNRLERLGAARWGATPVAASAWGMVASAASSSATLTTTAVADIPGMTVTFTRQAGRQYLALYSMTMSSVGAGTQPILTLTDSANTQLSSLAFTVAVGGVGHVASSHVVFTGSGSYTLKLRGFSGAGGNVTFNCGSANPGMLQVLDVGPA